MSLELKQAVVNKIYEGHEKNEEKLKAREELEKIEKKVC